MTPEETELMEHLAVRTDLPLREICSRLEHALHTPPFVFDSENETEWGIAAMDAIELNVSRPYEEGTLKEWDDSVPDGFDVGVTICVPRGAPIPSAERIASIAQTIASALRATVVHHRTWTGPGKNTRRETRHDP